MEQSWTDLCVFHMVVKGKVELVVAIHVDGIVITGLDETCNMLMPR